MVDYYCRVWGNEMKEPLNICVVDDDPIITELLEDHFRFSDIECTPVAFNDPEQAIHYLDEHPLTDVTITDYHMGKYTGADVIHHTPKNGLTILISGDITAGEMKEIDKSKVLFFDKPISMKQIDDAIRSFSRQIA